MQTPHTPGEKVEVDGFYRPSLASWTSELPRTPEGLAGKLNDIHAALPQTRQLLSQLVRLSRFVEPQDRILGTDPRRNKSRAFMVGNGVGLVVTAPLFIARRDVLTNASRFLDKDLGADVRYLAGHDDADTAHLRGDWLMNQGGFGQRCFVEIQADVEGIVDGLEVQITNQLYVKAGMGLGMLAVWEGFRSSEEAQMNRLAAGEMSDREFAVGLQQLLHND